jgi:hypothetical protein
MAVMELYEHRHVLGLNDIFLNVTARQTPFVFCVVVSLPVPKRVRQYVWCEEVNG